MKVIDNVRLYCSETDYEKDKIYHLRVVDGEFASVAEGRYEGDPAHMIDGEEQVLCPSFTDTHLHLLRYGLMKEGLDLRELETWEEVKQAISDDQTKTELHEDQWIVARGLMDNQYDDIARLAVASDLDELESEEPMFILHKDGHECVVNTPALEQIKQDDDLPLGHEEFIEQDADGNWTGRFKDTAVHFIKFHFREKVGDEIESALREALPHMERCGITSVHPDDLNYAGSYGMVWKSYRRLEEEGELTVRVFLHHYVFDIDEMRSFLERNDERTGDGTDKVRVGAFKIFVDGTHRLHTAALEQPYHDEPCERGILNYSQDDLNEMVQLAEDHNMQVAMHCIGDRAVRVALKAIEHAGNTMRHRIIHAQTLSDELLKKIADIKPCIETQPGFLLDEWNQYAKWVGEDRSPYCGMGRSLVETGAPFTLSSDAPIGPINPMSHIYAALNRTNRDGRPKGGWMPQEKIDIHEAFSRYTSVPAYLEFKEGEKGVVAEGAKADFILLEDYPGRFETADFQETEVQQTWIDGEKVYDIKWEQ